jgi:hypothetical protein
VGELSREAVWLTVVQVEVFVRSQELAVVVDFEDGGVKEVTSHDIFPVFELESSPSELSLS